MFAKDSFRRISKAGTFNASPGMSWDATFFFCTVFPRRSSDGLGVVFDQECCRVSVQLTAKRAKGKTAAGLCVLAADLASFDFTIMFRTPSALRGILPQKYDHWIFVVRDAVAQLLVSHLFWTGSGFQRGCSWNESKWFPVQLPFLANDLYERAANEGAVGKCAVWLAGRSS